jgi:hypothetical protein
VTDAWSTLERAGLPTGAVRPPPSTFDAASVREAVGALAASRVAAGDREPLLAWLRAWRHHWSASFAATLGREGDALIARLEADPYDVNRYLKLRRIAIENLSHVL